MAVTSPRASPAPVEASLNLLLLPSDVVTNIAHWLEPPALVKLAQTCQSLYGHILTNRSLWWDQVKSLVIEQCLPPHTFALKRPSITAETLRGIAVKPYRLLHSLEPTPRSSIPTLPISQSRVLPHAGLRSPFQAHILLPGGRWLLTANSDDTESQVCCWDLDNLNKMPAIYTCRKILGIHEDLESTPVVVAQSDPNHDRVVVTIRTCNDEGEYDVDVLYLLWHVQSDGEPRPSFQFVARLDPGNVYIGFMTLEGNYICCGFANRWVIWNWAEDTTTTLNLTETKAMPPVHVILHPPNRLLTVSTTGRIFVFTIPEMHPASWSHAIVHPSKPLAFTDPYGTVRACKTMVDWQPLARRPSPLICLKTTVVNNNAEDELRLQDQNTEKFATPALLFDYTDPSTSRDQPQAEQILPRLVYRRRGSLDWTPWFDITCGVLIEATYGHQRRLINTVTRVVPEVSVECHHVAMENMPLAPRRRWTATRGTMVIGVPAEGHSKEWTSWCFVSGRMIMLNPRSRLLEILDFE